MGNLRSTEPNTTFWLSYMHYEKQKQKGAIGFLRFLFILNEMFGLRMTEESYQIVYTYIYLQYFT